MLELAVSEDVGSYLFRQLVAGVLFLHRDHHVVHRDIKLDNTLLDGDPAAPRVVLCDFQFAKYWGPGALQRMQTHLGTPVYMDPQLISNRQDKHLYDPGEQASTCGWQGCALGSRLVRSKR